MASYLPHLKCAYNGVDDLLFLHGKKVDVYLSTLTQKWCHGYQQESKAYITTSHVSTFCAEQKLWHDVGANLSIVQSGCIQAVVLRAWRSPQKVWVGTCPPPPVRGHALLFVGSDFLTSNHTLDSTLTYKILMCVHRGVFFFYHVSQNHCWPSLTVFRVMDSMHPFASSLSWLQQKETADCASLPS